MRQAELGLYIQLAAAGRQFYGLVHGVDRLYAMVARRGLHHADDVLVYLLGAPGGGDGLYHVLAGEYLVEVVLPEQFIPGAGRASGYAGDSYGVEVEAVFLGESRLVGRQRGRRGSADGNRCESRSGDFQRPVLVVRVEEFPAVLRGFAVPLHGDAKRRHVGQQVVEFRDAAALGVVGRQHGDVMFVLQSGGGESAQDALRAALDEGAHAFGVHALQLLDELHGACHLLDQHVVDTLRVRRKKVRGHVGQDLHVGGSDRDVLKELAVRAHGRGHYLGMKGVAHGYLPRFYAQVLEQLYGLLHGLSLSGYHGLQRAVLVGADDVALYLLELYFHLVAAPGYGGHLAGVGYLHVGHFFGTAGDGAQAVLESKDAGRGGGGVLAQGVAYGHVGLYAEFLEQAVHRNVSRHHRGLGQLGLLYGGLAFSQFFLAFSGLAPDSLGQAHADHLVQDDVGLVEGVLHHLVLGGQVSHHVHVLGALPGEQQAHFGLVGPGLESVNALQLEVERRLGPGLGLGVSCHEGNFFHKIFRGLGDDGHAPGGLGLSLRRLGENRQRVGFRPL